MNDVYHGFELGPIRPPSEANSLLLRITRNCPWNRCKFCSLYKGEKFSIRPVDHVIQDIDKIRFYADEIDRIRQNPGGGGQQDLIDLTAGKPESERMALHTALNWVRGGMKSVFLQDANSMVVKPDHMVKILDHIRQTFPQVTRITTYARSQSVARIRDEDMARIAAAGLNRIHIGMESGADEILDLVKKGAGKETHITAGRKVKAAGIELSEYFMPGLGGAQFSRANAHETADAMNRINPDFIRIRTLAIPEQVELYKDVMAGEFTPMGDIEVAGELLLFLEDLNGIDSQVKSDHILNLLQEVDGRLPEDREKITAPIRRFLAMPADKQLLYIVGRRAGVFSRLGDLEEPELVRHAEEIRRGYGINQDNIDEFIAEMVRRFI